MKKKKINIFKKIFDIRYLAFDFVKITGAIPALIYLRLKRHYLSGKKQKHLFKGPAIIVCNHATYIDPIIVMVSIWNRRMSFIATEDLYSTKIRSLACLNKTLVYHGEPELKKETVENLYNCPVELIAHGVPHRVLADHDGSCSCHGHHGGEV